MVRIKPAVCCRPRLVVVVPEFSRIVAVSSLVVSRSPHLCFSTAARGTSSLSGNAATIGPMITRGGKAEDMRKCGRV